MNNDKQMKPKGLQNIPKVIQSGPGVVKNIIKVISKKVLGNYANIMENGEPKSSQKLDKTLKNAARKRNQKCSKNLRRRDRPQGPKDDPYKEEKELELLYLPTKPLMVALIVWPLRAAKVLCRRKN